MTTKSVASGVRLGPYELVSRLGAGGMGEVWRASDTRLDRHVAVKILPSELAKSVQFQVRFEREARAVSRLSHTNICTLHDVGQDDGVHYLVMELLEGESLADRIAKGPLPHSDVLRYGAQIADALSVAHRAGIIHRDLKPGNIMITKSGAKLLDFGLARTAAGVIETASPDDATAVAQSKPLTAEGTIVGTFQYMAPEQLEGQEADARTDVFALGAVLYEMTTGRRAFSGTTRTSLIAAIVGADPPPLRTLQPLASPTLEHIIAKALAKDPEERWQSAQDMAAELRWAASAGSQAGDALSAPTLARRKHRERLLSALLAVAVAAIAVGAWQYRREAARADRVSITDLAAPPGMELSNVGDNCAPPALSPDGRYVAFGVNDAQRGRSLWLRNLETGETKPISGTDGATFPFWSDDSRRIGFFADGNLKLTDVAGGAPIVIAPVPGPRGGTWKGDTIIFTRSGLSSLAKVSASGGAPMEATKLERSKYTSHRWPDFLPGGKHFLYLAGNHQDASGSSNAIYLASVEGGEPKLVTKTTSHAVYRDGWLLTVRDANLVAQKMSTDGTLSGEPKIIATGVQNDLGTWRSGFSVSQRGDLTYGVGQATAATTIDWVDRTGKVIETILQGERYWDVQISPDQKKLAVTMGDPSRQLWIYDLQRKTRTRIDLQASWAGLPAWAPDSALVITNAIVKGGFLVMGKRLDGSPASALSPPREPSSAISGRGSAVAPDGRTWVYANDGSLWRSTIDRPGPGERVTPQEWMAKDPSVSPDGRWILYTCTAGSRDEVFVAPFADPQRRLQVSDGGGTRPTWRADSREIYFVDGRSQVTAAAFAGAGGSPDIGESHPLFTFQGVVFDRPYSPAADGQRFAIVNMKGSEAVPVRIVRNWERTLR